MRYFRSFESYENIGNTKSPISTYPAKKNCSCMLRIRRDADADYRECDLERAKYEWFITKLAAAQLQLPTSPSETSHFGVS